MTLRPDLLPLMLAIALASFACRAGGFWLMRFVTVTPRVRSTLSAMPIAMMLGIVTPVALRGGAAEMAGFAATIVAMRLFRSDMVAMFSGVIAVALCRVFLPQ